MLRYAWKSFQCGLLFYKLLNVQRLAGNGCPVLYSVGGKKSRSLVCTASSLLRSAERAFHQRESTTDSLQAGPQFLFLFCLHPSLLLLNFESSRSWVTLNYKEISTSPRGRPRALCLWDRGLVLEETLDCYLELRMGL